MNVISFDFEAETVEIHTDNQNGTQYVPGLKDKRTEILQVIGFADVDMTNAISILEDLINGNIDKDEYMKRMDEELKKP